MWRSAALSGLVALVLVSLCDVVATAQCNEPDCSKAKFNYDQSSCLGPASWPDITPCWSTCSGSRQSPVNIRRNDATSRTSLGVFSFNIGPQQPFQVSTTIDGFKTNSKVSTTDHVVLSDVTQFGLSGNSFRLDGFHFHAGKFNNAKGSEHSFDGEFQPMELHMVFYNTKYPDISAAIQQSDGLLVIGVMAQVFSGARPTPFPGCVHTFQRTLSRVLMDSLKDKNPKSGKSCEETVDSTLTLQDLLPADRESYYTYEGSLTTPPCSETVTWIVMKCPIVVTKSVLRRFKRLEISKNGERLGVHGSRRPVQRGKNHTPFVLLKNF
uniref:carbonic anhydrase n=1 Tax=Crassostrea virginica TaxID=6565 RepID=A0A8B8AIW7_CRAVI|nr:N66 matrix protein-like [Crassostrea virginica]